MAKRAYQKPTFKMIALRPEERLAATCSYYYKIGLLSEGCTSNNFYYMNPADCLLATYDGGS